MDCLNYRWIHSRWYAHRTEMNILFIDMKIFTGFEGSLRLLRISSKLFIKSHKLHPFDHSIKGFLKQRSLIFHVEAQRGAIGVLFTTPASTV